MNPKIGDSQHQHAIVIGGSITGLMTARVLSDHFDQVTIIEKDKINDGPESRKGQPQARHLHGLLARGLQIMTHYFPDLLESLEAGGATVNYIGKNMRWHCYGGYRKRINLGHKGAVMSRPFLEWKIRERVQRIDNISFLDECIVKRLITDDQVKQIQGVEILAKLQRDTAILGADLVIDASGRGSKTPVWLQELGYEPPKTSRVKVRVGYASRMYERKPEEQDWVFVSPNAPQEKRTGGAIPIEGNRWMVTLSGWAGDHATKDEDFFKAFAKSLPASDVYDVITNNEPVSDIILHKFPHSQRRHYEKLKKFPEGYLVIGDAICSFNPLYGQGMTVGAVEAFTLDQLLKKRMGKLAGLAQPFFKKVSKVVDVPWRTAVGEDFRFPETTGKKAFGTNFINAYVEQIHKLSHYDEAIGKAFFKVTHMLKPPASLFHPRILFKVIGACIKLSKKEAKIDQEENFQILPS
jgi:2-polyprenyl-6-methoxyphenol hydroxylase-like FAD-dependent oxidoreductase